MDTPAGPHGNPSVPHGVTILGVYSQYRLGGMFIIESQSVEIAKEPRHYLVVL